MKITHPINRACKPAKGTVLLIMLGFSIKKSTNENISDDENSIKNVTVGKLILKMIKNRISPNPIASLRFIFSRSLL